MTIKRLAGLVGKNVLFWASRRIGSPLLPPDVLQISFTFDCNLSCNMCRMHEQKRLLQSRGRATEIPSPTIRKVIDEAAAMGVKAAILIGGEPLLKPDLFSLVKHARARGMGTVIVTNGVLLTRERIAEAAEAGVDWLSVSLDAATEGTFSRIRGKGVLARITANLRVLKDLRREGARQMPHVVAVCTIMNDNLEELVPLVALCRELGVERVLFQPVVANNIDQSSRESAGFGLVPEERLAVLDEAIDGLIAYKKRSKESFDYIGNSLRYLALIKRYFRGRVRPREFPCYAGYNRMQIVQEGKVYFCVPQNAQEATFGDVAAEPLRALWYSSRAKEYRRLITRCAVPCLQWCATRDDFGALEGEFHKLFLRHE
jgi:PqqA peptide cyclase